MKCQPAHKSAIIEGYAAPGGAEALTVYDNCKAGPSEKIVLRAKESETGTPVQSVPTQAYAGKQLPYTGLDVSLVAGIGFALIVLGIVLYLTTRAVQPR